MGCPGRALRLAEDPEQAQRRREWAELLGSMPGASWLDIFATGARFAAGDTRRNRAVAKEALEVWETYLRDAVLTRSGAADIVTGSSPPDWPDIGREALIGLWRSAREAADRLQNNVNPRLTVEAFLADVASGGATSSIDKPGALFRDSQSLVPLP
jgi:hypothetical protein